MWFRKRVHRRRVIPPLLFDDRCPECGEFLLPRDFRAETPLGYRLPPGWLSEHLAAGNDAVVHARCRTSAPAR